MKSKLQKAIESESEAGRRIEARLALARSCLMNDTKWKEVLATLSRSGNLRTPIRWRFVCTDQLYVAKVPRAEILLANYLPDDLPYPYGPYRHIDWIEVPPDDPTGRTPATNDLAALTAELVTLGQLPLFQTDSGLKIAGYIW